MLLLLTDVSFTGHLLYSIIRLSCLYLQYSLNVRGFECVALLRFCQSSLTPVISKNVLCLWDHCWDQSINALL